MLAGSRREIEALFASPDPDDAAIARVVEIVGESGAWNTHAAGAMSSPARPRPLSRACRRAPRSPRCRRDRIRHGQAASDGRGTGIREAPPGFHAIVLTIGFIVGGFLTAFARRFLPAGPVKEFLTWGSRHRLDRCQSISIIVKFALGPIALDVSLLSLLGVLVAYLIARSLF